jgi:small subunit ribosomal protein S7
MRRKTKVNRSIKPDRLYHSNKVAKFVNYVMQQGKKSVAQRVVYDSFSFLKGEGKTEPIEIFEEAVKNVGPHTELRSRRVGGANYQIPHEVSPRRRMTLAMKWIIEAARAKTGQPMSRRLADEFLAASRNEGEAIRRRDNVLRMAEANRAFAHFARPAGGAKSLPRPVR